jgi:predicted DNA-binding transcriptional regulator AlpA
MAAHLAGVSVGSWWRLNSAGKIPRPNKLGGRTLWRLRELREWIAAGCPDRGSWEARPKP